jgi:hypothetical protein
VPLFARRSAPSDDKGSLRNWLAPPSDPIRYRLRHRLKDARQGRRDGRLAVPRLGDTPADGDDAQADVTRAPVETAYLKELCRCCEEQIAEERLAHHHDTASFDRRLAASVTTANTLARAVEMAGVRLDEVSKPLAEELVEERRIAERDVGERPESLVRARRMGEHDRRVRAAQADYLAAQEKFADALRESAVLSDLVQRRADVTRIRERRIHDHTWRRIAVYWRTLVRVHPRGPELNARIASLGPRLLPEWARDEHDRDRL